MTIAFDAESNATPGTGTLSWTHTPVGTPRAALVFITQDTSATDEVSGVTYGGQAMTRVVDAKDTADEPGKSYAYALLSGVPSGAQTVAVTVTGASPKTGTAYTVTAGADVEVEASGVKNESGSNPTVVLATGAGVECFVAAALYSGIGTPSSLTPGADYTETLEHDFGANIGSVIRRTANSTGGDVTVTWTSVNDDAALSAVALTEAAGGGGGGIAPLAAAYYAMLRR